MKSAGVEVPGNPAALWNYRVAARNVFDCGAESDKGWPRDIGFLRCMQKRFPVSFHQSNLFLRCLDLTEGVMLENVQTDTSTLFFGSYNYAALLLAAMGVMAGFLLFTAGGIYWSDEIRLNGVEMQEMGANDQPITDANGKPVMKWVPNDYNYVASPWEWAPLAAIPNLLALLWSITMFFASMFYTYPLKDSWSDAVSIDGGASSFPGTIWTGYMCSGMSFLMGEFFASCLVEWYSDRSARGVSSAVEKYGATVAGQEEAIVDNGSSDNGTGVFSGNGDVKFQSPQSILLPGSSYGNDKYSYTEPIHIFSAFRNQLPYRRLGARYNPQLYYSDHSDMSMKLTPLLNKVYALAWVFADGLLFVGMINSQNSPLNENVVAIWFFITPYLLPKIDL
jgi:hypothetical protein